MRPSTTRRMRPSTTRLLLLLLTHLCSKHTSKLQNNNGILIVTAFAVNRSFQLNFCPLRCVRNSHQVTSVSLLLFVPWSSTTKYIVRGNVCTEQFHENKSSFSRVKLTKKLAIIHNNDDQMMQLIHESMTIVSSSDDADVAAMSVSLGKVSRIKLPGQDDENEKSFVGAMGVPTFKSEYGNLSYVPIVRLRNDDTIRVENKVGSVTIPRPSCRTLQWFYEKELGPAFVIDNVLSKFVCEDIIRTCETTIQGFKHYNPRNSNKSKNNHGAMQIIVTQDMVDYVSSLVTEFIDVKQVEQRQEEIIRNSSNDSSNNTTEFIQRKELVCCGLNRRWRIYRYLPNGVETFAPHIDAGFPPSGLSNDGTEMVWDTSVNESIVSRLTALLYLNDDFDGGETNFYLPLLIQEQQQQQQNHTSANTNYISMFMNKNNNDSTTSSSNYKIVESIKPRTGSCLIFPQAVGEVAVEYARQYWPLHEGSPVYDYLPVVVDPNQEKRRPKYVIRSDILFTEQTRK